MEFVDVEAAKAREGLRIVTVGDIPSPWSESAKGLFQVKKLPFVGVRFSSGDAAVAEWTGANNAPAVFWNDEPPRTGWAEILLLTERIAKEPRLLPEDAAERAWMIGQAHEICGEMGLGWSRRVFGVHQSLESNGQRGFPKPVAEYLAKKYGYRTDNRDEAHRRVIDVLGMLSKHLHAQREKGSPFYHGDRISALDVYSAAFMGICQPLPPEQCPMPDMLRAAFESNDPETEKALDPILLEHRDFVYESYLELPIAL